MVRPEQPFGWPASAVAGWPYPAEHRVEEVVRLEPQLGCERQFRDGREDGGVEVAVRIRRALLEVGRPREPAPIAEHDGGGAQPHDQPACLDISAADAAGDGREHARIEPGVARDQRDAVECGCEECGRDRSRMRLHAGHHGEPHRLMTACSVKRARGMQKQSR